MSRILVTGGGGFIGSALVSGRARGAQGARARRYSRGARHRLAELAGDVECIAGDIRSAETVVQAAAGVDEIHHLAYVNGTQFFYSAPELVLDVPCGGMISVIEPAGRTASARWSSPPVRKSIRPTAHADR